MDKDAQIFIGPDEIMTDCNVCRAKAYNIIRELNNQLLQTHPNALILPGKVNRKWYDAACLRDHN